MQTPDVSDVVFFGATLSTSHIKSTRKEHTCYICNGVIAVGSKANRLVMRSYDKFYSLYLHKYGDCNA